MTAKDFIDYFKPGTEAVLVLANNNRIIADIVGWRDNGVVVREDESLAFVPFSNLVYVGVDAPDVSVTLGQQVADKIVNQMEASHA